MAIKRKGIVAVPGKYTYGDVTEIKTAEELRLAAERQPIIMMTMGHPVDGVPRAEDVIGTVSQKWNTDKNCVTGDFWFHDEKIPDNIKQQLVNNQPVAISGGIMIDDIKDGVQEGIVYTHMAILDGEDPKCPLGTCGVNIRMESNPTQNRRLEQQSELDAPVEKEPEVAHVEEVTEETAEPVVEAEVETEETETEIPKTDKPAEDNPEEEVAVPDEKEEVILEPEVEIPTDTPTVHKEYEVDESGMIRWIPQTYKKEKL